MAKHLASPFLRSVRYERQSGKTEFPYNLELFCNGFSLEFSNPITIISGENGSGKSTMLEVLASGCGFNVSGGNGSHLYEARNDIDEFARQFRFSWLPKTSQGFFFRAESFFNYASYIDELAVEFGQEALKPYGGRSLHEQSHGESFLSLFKNRLGGRGVYIFDEPEAALSPMRQIAFLTLLQQLLKDGQSQIIMATHSPILMAYPYSQFLYLREGKFEEMAYTDTEHYKTTRRFLENPGFYLSEI